MSSTQNDVQEAHGERRSITEVLDQFPVTRVHVIALVLVVLGGMFEVFEQIILSALGPSLQKALGFGTSALAGLSTATLLAIVVGGIVGGMLSDKFGRRLILTISVGIYCAGAVLAAFSSDYAFLMLARIVTGLGVGGEIAVGLTYLSELSPTRIRGVFVSLFNTISAGVGMFLVFAYTLFVLGPFAHLVGAGDNDWRWAFGLLGLPAALIFFFRRYLPESPLFLLRKGDVTGTDEALTRLATGRLRLRPDDKVTGYFSANSHQGLPSVAQGESRRPLLDVFSARLRKRTTSLSLCAFLAWGAQFSIIIIMPLLLVAKGYSIAGSLTFTMVQNIGALVGALLASYGAYVFPRRRMVTAGAAGGAVFLVLFAAFAESPFLILTLGFVFQMFVMMTNTTIWTWAPELFPTRLRGSGTAIVVNFGFLGGALLPLASTALVDAGGQILALIAVAVMYVLLALIAQSVIETHKVPLDET